MADGDEHFRLGVEHGYTDEPLYRWQDRFHQDRYETGYACGRWQRIRQQAVVAQQEQPFMGPRRADSWDAFCERMRWKGFDRDR